MELARGVSYAKIALSIYCGHDMNRTRDTAGTGNASISDRAFALLQYPLPTHWLSNLVWHLTRLRTRWLAGASIRLFMRAFGVSLADAKLPDVSAFACFNEFFTRELRDGARPLPQAEAALACPVDGRIGQLGKVAGGRIVQAKGHDYSVAELLADRSLAAGFEGGVFCTLYLAPSDYHRVHMPCAGRVSRTVLIPGRLFSVNPATTRTVPRLFTRNERLVCLFEGDNGPFVLVMIGAMLVGSIETVWGGRMTPPRARQIAAHEFAADGERIIHLPRGAEMGRFNMGSSVVLLFPAGSARWCPSLAPGQVVRMGQALGDSYCFHRG